MKSILLVKKLLGLVEMTSGLVNASFSLPEWQAAKMIFFAPRVILFFSFSIERTPHQDKYLVPFPRVSVFERIC